MFKKEDQPPINGKFKAFIIRMLFAINIILGLLLLMCFWNVYISNETIGFLLAIATGLYPILFIINILFLILWIVLKKKIKYICAFFVLIGALNITSIYQFNFLNQKTLSKEALEENTDFKVFSYNVRLFNLYKWLPKKGIDDSIINLITSQNASIICLQESYNELENDRSPIKKLEQKLGKYAVFDACQNHLSGKKFMQTGNVILSKFPIKHTGIINFDNSNNVCIFADLKTDKGIIRIYNIHLQSFHFTKRDVQLFNALKKGEGIDTKNKNLSLDFIRKLQDTYSKRAAQVRQVIKHIEASPYPILLVGDFNDAPISQTYANFEKILSDSFKESGKGLGNTYNGKIPFFRIDYLWYDANFESYNYEVLNASFSDHFPIVSHFKNTSKKNL